MLIIYTLRSSLRDSPISEWFLLMDTRHITYNNNDYKNTKNYM